MKNKHKPNVDFIFNGSCSTPDIGEKLMAVNWDMGALRPWRCPNSGRSYVTLNKNGKEVHVLTNADATLTRDAWIHIDTQILKVARERLRAVADLRAAGLTFVIPNGMGKPVLEYQRQSDINDATMSMDGLRYGTNDRHTYDTKYLPLPIIHKDFEFSLRQIQASRDGGAPLDTSMAEDSGRKVAEYAERLLLGRLDTFEYADGIIYGYTNYADALTKVMTTPTGANQATTLAEVLAMKTQLQAANHYGPFMIYVSNAWDQYLDNDYNVTYPNMTLRDRLRQIDNVQDVRTIDFLAAAGTFKMVMIEMVSSTVRLVIGMEVMTLQWDTDGGLKKKFKVMTIMVPQLRADKNENTGILVGTAP